MNWNDILAFWVMFQVGNWLSYYILKTNLETSICNTFFTGIFILMMYMVM